MLERKDAFQTQKDRSGWYLGVAKELRKRIVQQNNDLAEADRTPQNKLHLPSAHRVTAKLNDMVKVCKVRRLCAVDAFYSD